MKNHQGGPKHKHAAAKAAGKQKTQKWLRKHRPPEPASATKGHRSSWRRFASPR